MGATTPAAGDTTKNTVLQEQQPKNVLRYNLLLPPGSVPHFSSRLAFGATVRHTVFRVLVHTPPPLPLRQSAYM